MRELAEPGRHCSRSMHLGVLPGHHGKAQAAMLPASLISCRSLSDGMSWFSSSVTEALLEAEIVDIGPGGSRHVPLDVHVSGPHTVFEAKLGRSGAEEQLSQPAVDIYCIGYGCRLHRETLQWSKILPLGRTWAKSSMPQSLALCGLAVVKIISRHHLPIRRELHDQCSKWKRVYVADVLSSRSAERLIPSQAQFPEFGDSENQPTDCDIFLYSSWRIFQPHTNKYS